MRRLTERQIDHLRVLATGGLHRPIKHHTSASVYTTLVEKGLARAEQFQVFRWAITPAGRSALAQSEDARKKGE